MAAAPKYVPYDEFLRSEVDSEVPHEWGNGEVYAMSRGTPEHGRLFFSPDSTDEAKTPSESEMGQR